MAEQTLSQRFGRRMRIAREVRGWRQIDLAEQLGWSRGSIAHVEAGRRRVFLDDAVAVAAVFGLEIAWFLESETKA